MEKPKREPITCGICGKTFVPSSKCHKYCEDCRERVKKAYADYVEHGETAPRTTCIVCGKVIDRKAYKSKLVCSMKCGHSLYAITDRYRAKRRGAVKRKYVKTHEPPRKRHLKKNKRLDADIAEARRLGLSYGMYMVQKREGVIE